MLPLVLCVALSQAKVAVVQSSNLGVAQKRASELTHALTDLLSAEKLEPLESKEACDTRQCLFARGKELGTAAVVAVAFASLGKDTVMDLECIQLIDGKSVAQTTFTMKGANAKLPFEAQAFAADVYRAVAPREKVASDAPKETPAPKLTPEPVTPPPPVVAERAGSPVVPVAFGAAAVGAAVATGVLLLLANSDLNRLKAADDGMYFHMPRSQAEQLNASLSTKASAALGTGIATGVLALAAVLFGVL